MAILPRKHKGQAYHVIKVHEYVNERVEEAKEGGVSTWKPSHSRPDTQRHDPMVNDVKGRHLSEFFSSQERKLLLQMWFILDS